MGARMLAWVLPALLVAPGCSAANTFACGDDGECPSGRCEPEGFCSFPNDGCPSGWQYGEFSGPASGQCVPEDMGTGSGGMSGPTTNPTAGTAGSDTMGSATSGSDSGDPTGTPGTCGAGQACVAVPAGWSGPVTLGPPGMCEGGFEFRGASSYDGPHTCGCECQVDAPNDCADVPVFLEFFSDPACGDMPQLSLQLSTECDFLGSPSPFFLRAAAGGEASCDVQVELVGEPIVGIDERDACSSSSGTCVGGVCADVDTAQCVFAEGDTACPGGDFTQRVVLYQDHADNRECSACGCEGAYSCEGEVEVVTSPNGCGSSGSPLPIGTCSGSSTAVFAAEIVSIEAEPATVCETSGGEAIGSVEPTAPVTVCCTG